ncbi:MAG: DNA translocase FtsK 4TM domain-containing protein [Burkholderiales bacterium]|nr:DNA translocase FtsK 4TM domain-containing protein [Burkholderiales bacterium]
MFGYQSTSATKSSRSSAKTRDPLAPKFSRLLKEAWWIIALALGVYLALILFTYDRGDPGFSHSGTHAAIHNKGGDVGAWLADFLLYLFGFSAWWWVGLFLFGIFLSYYRIEATPLTDRRPVYISLAGFFILVLASSGLEALRLYGLKVTLPFSPGGVLGDLLGKGVGSAFGFTGATLALLALLAVGFSLFTGLSWLKFIERLGYWLESAWLFTISTVQRWRDQREGEAAMVKREEKVAEGRRRLEDREPVHIEPQMVEIPLSARVVEEKQVPLFADLPDTELPPLALLDGSDAPIEAVSAETLEFTSRLIERKLADFNVEVKVLAAYPGPVITRYEIEPATGVKGSQIVNLVKDLARALSVVSIRMVETIPGKSCMGLEIPNPHRQTVRLSEIVSSKIYNDMPSPLTLALGKDISGKPAVGDLARMPHLLVAGTTGSGKSVAINAMILSLIYKATPAQVRLILIDPKMLELSIYEGIPHLLAPVVTDMKQAASALNWCVAEMERRYKLMSVFGVRHLAGYNSKVREAREDGRPLFHPFSVTPDTPVALEELPLIVVVIDELADLMMVVGKKVEELIARIAQKARASGIHLILATQRPSVDVITGLIKANIPTRIAFQVASKIDSRTILDQMGAETLLGQGDMLYLPPGTGLPQRVHGAFVADQEVHRVVDHLKKRGEPQYIEGLLTASDESADSTESGNVGSGGESDPLYDEAVAIVLKSRRASISFVQRHLRIGYNRAARLLEEMERAGLVSAMQTNGNREVLAPVGQGS